jgi:DNA polymerase-3 subunit epsilon
MFDLLKKITRGGPPHELILQNRSICRNIDQTKALSEYSFVVFDTELTGLKQKKDEIISIGAVRIKDHQIDLGDTFHQYIRPVRLDHTKATLVHRITPEQLREAPELEEVLPTFFSYIGSDVLVGHYIGLDMSFLQKATEKLFNGTLANPCIDTLRIAQGYKRAMLGYQDENTPSADSYTLKDLSREFNLPIFDAHDALEDAMQTAYLFLFLIKKFRQGGLVTLRDLYHAGRVTNFRVF